MNFTHSELEMIYQYAAPTKAETPAGLKKAAPVISDTLTRVIMENAVDKLQRIPEPECSCFIADTKAAFLEERDNSIRRRLAEAKAKAPVMQGHDLMGEERFMPEARHMITLDVLNNDNPVGYKGGGNATAFSCQTRATRTPKQTNGKEKSKSAAMLPYVPDIFTLIKGRKLTAENTPRNDTQTGQFQGVGLSLSAILPCFSKEFTEGKSRRNDIETIHKKRLSRNTGQQADKGAAMPRMSKKRKRKWAFFLNDRNRITYNDLCRKCRRPCKQSFRAIVIDCPLYYSKRAKDRP